MLTLPASSRGLATSGLCKALKAARGVDPARPSSKTPRELLEALARHLDCVDLHDAHSQILRITGAARPLWDSSVSPNERASADDWRIQAVIATVVVRSPRSASRSLTVCVVGR